MQDMDMYACDSCGYYFDPEFGDTENGIEPGTPFTSLPTDWRCPECKASKKEFFVVDDDDDYDDDDFDDVDDDEDDDDEDI